MRADNCQIVKSLESFIRSDWHNLHEYRRKYKATSDEFYRRSAEETWYDLRQLLAIRRGL